LQSETQLHGYLRPPMGSSPPCSSRRGQVLRLFRHTARQGPGTPDVRALSVQDRIRGLGASLPRHLGFLVPADTLVHFRSSREGPREKGASGEEIRRTKESPPEPDRLGPLPRESPGREEPAA